MLLKMFQLEINRTLCTSDWSSEHCAKRDRIVAAGVSAEVTANWKTLDTVQSMLNLVFHAWVMKSLGLGGKNCSG